MGQARSGQKAGRPDGSAGPRSLWLTQATALIAFGRRQVNFSINWYYGRIFDGSYRRKLLKKVFEGYGEKIIATKGILRIRRIGISQSAKLHFKGEAICQTPVEFSLKRACPVV